jgi:DNA-binding IclR family transcriptional regulator
MGESEPPGSRPAGVREVKSAARTIEILEQLAARGNEPITIRELCAAIDAPRSSIYALLRTLTDAGWVRTDASRSLYSIGIRALLAGTTYLDTDPLLKVVRPHMSRLGQQVGATVHFGRLDGTDIVYLATWEAPGRGREVPRLGRRLPAYATALGQSILARLGPDAAAHLPPELAPVGPGTLVTADALRHALSATRRRGYALEREQSAPGLACLAVAVDGPAAVPDALSASMAAGELTPGREREVGAALRDTAETIAEILAGLGKRLA